LLQPSRRHEQPGRPMKDGQSMPWVTTRTEKACPLGHTRAPLGTLLVKSSDSRIESDVVRRRRRGRCGGDGGDCVAADDLVELGGEGGCLDLFGGKRRVGAVVALEKEVDCALLGFLRERGPVSGRVHEK
jgi:hypothetical protein